jgi:hypothetical protein
VPWTKKQSKAIPLLSLRAFVACKKVETYLDDEIIFIYCSWLSTQRQGRQTGTETGKGQLYTKGDTTQNNTKT